MNNNNEYITLKMKKAAFEEVLDSWYHNELLDVAGVDNWLFYDEAMVCNENLGFDDSYITYNQFAALSLEDKIDYLEIEQWIEGEQND